MKQLYFCFLLLISPTFIWANDPVKCDCATGYKEFADLGRLRHHHEILSALEKAGKKDVAEIVYALDKMENANSAKPMQDSVFKRKILKLCIDIAGDSSRAFLRQSESLWKSLLTEKDPAKIDAYKARLACFAIQSRKYLPLEDSTQIKALEEQIHVLSNNILKWKIGVAIGGALFSALTVFGVWLYRREKKKNSVLKNNFIDQLKDLETEKNQLIADKASLIESNDLLKKERARIPYLEEESQKPKIHQPDPPPPPQPPPIRKIYARPPSGNLLFQVSDFFEPQTTYFVIEVNPNDDSNGNLRLVEDGATLLQAFSMIDTLRDACELRSTGAPTSVAQLIKNVAGEVNFIDGYWTITKKIVLEW